MLWTDDHAGRLQTDIGPVSAIMTFGRRPGVRVHMNRIVRTSLKTGFAANALTSIELHDPVFPLVHGRHRANGDTRRVFAVVTTGDLEMAGHIGKDAGLHPFDPGSVHTEGDLIFRFTRSGACVAADALPVVDQKAEALICVP